MSLQLSGVVIIKNKLNPKAILWALEPIEIAINLFGNGSVIATKRGSIKLGKITMQRKGGDNGRPSANMLQFKINPTLLVDKSIDAS